jgi:hypothetical protein
VTDDDAIPARPPSRPSRAPRRLAWLGAALLGACGGGADDAAPADAAPNDAAPSDAAPSDAAPNDAAPADAAPTCGPAALSARDGVVLLADPCGRVEVRLAPAAHVGGAWRRADTCATTDGGLSCPLPGLGTLEVALDGDVARLSFVAGAAAEVEGLALDGEGRVEGARAWLSNGFQSWSNSGAVALGPAQQDASLRSALRAAPDAEVLRPGRSVSWFYTLAGGGETDLFAGALRADRWRPWAHVGTLDGGALRVRLVSGATGERVRVAAGERLDAEPWMLRAAEPSEAMLARYGAAVPARRAGARPEAGWNSWYDLWDTVDEAAVRDNAARWRALAGPHLPEGAPRPRIVVDDGWQVRWGEWTPNDKFPSGLDGLAADLRADGFAVGVWLAPLLVDRESALVAEHPDWFVAGAGWTHLEEGPMAILDPTHPEAAAHLAGVVRRLVDAGYDFLKIDFLFAGALEGERHEAVTGMQAYARALRVVREAAGPDVTLLAVGAPPIAAFEHVDAWRVGGDIAFQVAGAVYGPIGHQARSLAARWFLCEAVLCDADPVLLRDLRRNEAEVGAWVVAASGGAWFLSDDLRRLDPARVGWAVAPRLVGRSLGGVPARPDPPWPADLPDTLASSQGDLQRDRNSARAPARWRLPDGGTLLLNTGDAPADVDGVEVAPRSAIVR